MARRRKKADFILSKTPESLTQPHVHIITHQVPYPPDFGGVVDLYYKIQALYKLGISVHLHCFTTNAARHADLDKYCHEVHYYKRDRSIKAISLRLPFIVASRIDSQLEHRLKQDNYPILFEGIHTTYLLYKNTFKDRRLLVRLHNVEFEYYGKLALHEKSFMKRLYFRFESRLLKKYEAVLAHKAVFIAVSEKDVKTYQQQFGCASIFFMPVFIPHNRIQVPEGVGSYCLYHGNLSVNENETAVRWLVDHVFSKNGYPFVIAGKSPDEAFAREVERNENCCVVGNPDQESMQDLVAKAQIHVLPSFNSTGVKLKLINALCNGRHCLVNLAGVEGSGLENFCEIAETPDEFKNKIRELFTQPVKVDHVNLREQILTQLHNNNRNAEILATYLR